MSLPFTPLVQSLPASTPFVGPETLERQRGEQFRARIGANESAFGISPNATRAITDALNTPGVSWYADPENYDLRCALAEKHGVHIDEICVDAGIDSLLGLTVRLFVEPGTAVVTSAGAYPTFNYHVAGFGGELNTVNYRDNKEDPDALLAATKSHNAKLCYLANPDNPMGTSHPDHVVQAMIDGLPDHCTLCLDEAYIDFTDAPLAPAIDTTNSQVIRFRTFSKAYGMAGMRVGYAIAHKDIITAFNKVRNHFAMNRLSQLAALASVKDDAFLTTVRKQVKEGRQRIEQMADSLQLSWLPSATNFVAVDLETTERAQQLLKLLQHKNVFMRMPGVAPLNRYIRVGVGTVDEQAYLEEVLGELLHGL